jgi:hypothetical protein
MSTELNEHTAGEHLRAGRPGILAPTYISESGGQSRWRPGGRHRRPPTLNAHTIVTSAEISAREGAAGEGWGPAQGSLSTPRGGASYVTTTGDCGLAIDTCVAPPGALSRHQVENALQGRSHLRSGAPECRRRGPSISPRALGIPVGRTRLSPSRQMSPNLGAVACLLASRCPRRRVRR